MDMMTLTSNVLTGGATVSTKNGTVMPSGDGADPRFFEMMRALGLTLDAQSDLTKQDPAALLELLAALSGGLSPLHIGTTPAFSSDGTPVAAEGEAILVEITVGERKIPLDLQDLPWTNEQLVMLLQQFDAAPKLVTVLLENPQERLAATVAAHPELRQDLSNAMTQAVQKALTQPNLVVADAKVAEMMKAILAQVVNVRETRPAELGSMQQTQSPLLAPKAASVFGKLQASISSHAVQMVQQTEPVVAANVTTFVQPQQTVLQALQVTKQETAPVPAGTAAASMTAEGEMSSQEALPLGTNLAAPLAPSHHARLLKAEPTTVTLQANRFEREFPNMIVKRAALLESPGLHEFRVILEPEGLGQIEVRVQAASGQISLQIMADSAASKMMIDAGLANLRSQLQQQGIQADRIDVSTSGRDADVSSGLPQERGGSGQQQGQSGQQPSRTTDAVKFSLDASDATEPVVLEPEADGIDVTA